jgi:hypothetical protein
VVEDESGAIQAELTRQVTTLRSAVARYERGGSLPALDEAFVAAATAVAMLRGERASQAPSITEVRDLFVRLPDFERLVAVAVGEADRSARAAGQRLWQSFELRSDPPRWTDEERWTAALLVACACAPLDGHGRGWLRERLLRLASDRWAGLLAAELRAADEALWQRALGERYVSVHRRCAPRSARQTLGLSDLLHNDPKVFNALRQRLSRWLTDGGSLEQLPGELEATFVYGRTPARLA